MQQKDKTFIAEKLFPEELAVLRRDLLVTLFAYTSMQLSIYQRGLLINDKHCINRMKAAKSCKKSIGISKAANAVWFDEQDKDNLPDVSVLNKIKLDNDLRGLRHIFTLGKQELVESYLSSVGAEPARMLHMKLYTAIEAQKTDRNEMERAQEDLSANRATLDAIQEQLTSERKTAEERLLSQDKHIALLRHNLRNVRLLNDLELRLVQKWELNRYTQAIIVGENEERVLYQQITELKRKLDGERRIISEVDKFSVKQFAELRSRIARWQEKYALEMHKKCSEIQEQERRMLELRKSHERHVETCEERKKFVREYITEKEAERAVYEQQMHRVRCAVVIQAWWRGTMVRRGLGPFKKKTKKGKRGKGKTK